MIRLNSVDELYYSQPMGIVSADTKRLPKGKSCMDNSNLLPNNPAHQNCTIVPLNLLHLVEASVPILTYFQITQPRRTLLPLLLFTFSGGLCTNRGGKCSKINHVCMYVYFQPKPRFFTIFFLKIYIQKKQIDTVLESTKHIDKIVHY
jgi:hypothetical protein